MNNLHFDRVAVARLLSHAALHVPYYRDQDWARSLRRGKNVRFRELPITPTSSVKQDTSLFYSELVPPSEGPVFDKFTSGSMGEPALIKKTARHFKINANENRRLQRGWEYEKQTGVVRTASPTKDHKAGAVERSNHNVWTLYGREPKAIIELLHRTKASHISLYPSQTISVLEIAPPLDFLRLITTVGEVVPPELTHLIANLPECLHHDVYGSIETGIIASKCRECNLYHLALKHLIVELLDSNGNPVQPGTVGRVVVTPLFNFAMPILRYELGDYAIITENVECSVAPFALTKILGREKNLFLLPDGSRIAPMIPAKDALSLGIRKFKMRQVSPRNIEVLYVPASPRTELRVEDLQPLIDQFISPLIQVRPVRVDEIKPGPNGKYIMHESLCAPLMHHQSFRA